MKIYTKTGDGGETGLYGNARIKKASARIHAIGQVDELNAALGVARAEGAVASMDTQLARIQSLLFDVGAELASVENSNRSFASLSDEDANLLEHEIDEMTSELPPLTSFILPGGCRLASQLHFARTVCRRAERSVLELHEQEPIRSEVLAFMNRLSDWLFVSARWANLRAGVDDVPWKPSQTSG